MSAAIPFADYLGTLGPLSTHIDPLAPTQETEAIRAATLSLAALPTISRESLATHYRIRSLIHCGNLAHRIDAL